MLKLYTCASVMEVRPFKSRKSSFAKLSTRASDIVPLALKFDGLGITEVHRLAALDNENKYVDALVTDLNLDR